MDHELAEAHPPRAEVFRIGWRGDPLSPPPWERATVDGTFGNRFDDPDAAAGRSPMGRFRCLYLGTTAEAAFGESLAGNRVPISILAKLRDAVDDEESIAEVLAGAAIDMADPSHPRGMVSADWQARHQIGRMRLNPSLRFANVATLESHQYLRHALADVAATLDIDDVDFSTMLNQRARRFTQACARHIYERHDDGIPRFAGIRYLSRLNALEWGCWAGFSERLEPASYTVGFPQDITPDNADLRRVARYFDLTIEGLDGSLLHP